MTAGAHAYDLLISHVQAWFNPESSPQSPIEHALINTVSFLLYIAAFRKRFLNFTR